MKNALSSIVNPQSSSYRTVVAMLAVMLAATLYIWVVQSAEKGRVKAKASVSMLREQAARLEQQAAEYERLRAKPPATASAGDLKTALEAHAINAGVSRASMRIESVDANRLQLRIGAVSFSDWLTMAVALQSMRLRLESCRIEAMSTPGLVSITATIVRVSP